MGPCRLGRTLLYFAPYAAVNSKVLRWRLKVATQNEIKSLNCKKKIQFETIIFQFSPTCDDDGWLGLRRRWRRQQSQQRRQLQRRLQLRHQLTRPTDSASSYHLQTTYSVKPTAMTDFSLGHVSAVMSVNQSVNQPSWPTNQPSWPTAHSSPTNQPIWPTNRSTKLTNRSSWPTTDQPSWLTNRSTNQSTKLINQPIKLTNQPINQPNNQVD